MAEAERYSWVKPRRSDREHQVVVKVDAIREACGGVVSDRARGQRAQVMLAHHQAAVGWAAQVRQRRGMRRRHLRGKDIMALRWDHLWKQEFCVAKWWATLRQEGAGRWFWVMNYTEYPLSLLHTFSSLTPPSSFLLSSYQSKVSSNPSVESLYCTEKLSRLIMPNSWGQSAELWNHWVSFLWIPGLFLFPAQWLEIYNTPTV